jgi:hypothetical protein
MVRHGIVAGEPDHTGLGWLSRQLQRLLSRSAKRQPRITRRERRPGDGEAKAKAAAAPSEPRQRGKWAFPTGLTPSGSLVTIAATPEPGSSSTAVPSACP